MCKYRLIQKPFVFWIEFWCALCIYSRSVQYSRCFLYLGQVTAVLSPWWLVLHWPPPVIFSSKSVVVGACWVPLSCFLHRLCTEQWWCHYYIYKAISGFAKPFGAHKIFKWQFLCPKFRFKVGTVSMKLSNNCLCCPLRLLGCFPSICQYFPFEYFSNRRQKINKNVLIFI